MSGILLDKYIDSAKIMSFSSAGDHWPHRTVLSCACQAVIWTLIWRRRFAGYDTCPCSHTRCLLWRLSSFSLDHHSGLCCWWSLAYVMSQLVR